MTTELQKFPDEYRLSPVHSFVNDVREFMKEHSSYMTVKMINEQHFSDGIRYIMSTLSRVGQELDLKSGAFIAGGQLSRLLEGPRDAGTNITGDVDIFFRSERDADIAIKYWTSKGTRAIMNTSNSSTFMSEGIEFNLVRYAPDNKPTARLDKFDFDICRMATDGKAVLWHTKAIKNFGTSMLTFNPNWETTDHPTLLARLGKYGKRGYIVTHDSASKIIDMFRAIPTINVMPERAIASAQSKAYYNS